jgi:hypothetical protein
MDQAGARTFCFSEPPLQLLLLRPCTVDFERFHWRTYFFPEAASCLYCGQAPLSESHRPNSPSCADLSPRPASRVELRSAEGWLCLARQCLLVEKGADAFLGSTLKVSEL